MVCDKIINKLEQKLGRKLNPTERKKVQEKLHHTETSESENKHEEECIAC